MEERLKKQLEFILEADKSKFIGRQTYLSDGIRKENDAEHSWHLALMTALLSEYAKEKIDVQKTMLMVLIHDRPPKNKIIQPILSRENRCGNR